MLVAEFELCNLRDRLVTQVAAYVILRHWRSQHLIRTFRIVVFLIFLIHGDVFRSFDEVEISPA